MESSTTKTAYARREKQRNHHGVYTLVKVANAQVHSFGRLGASVALLVPDSDIARRMHINRPEIIEHEKTQLLAIPGKLVR